MESLGEKSGTLYFNENVFVMLFLCLCADKQITSNMFISIATLFDSVMLIGI